MDILDVMGARHSVRQYTDRPIGPGEAEALRAEVEAINAESGLTFRLVLEEPGAFGGMMAHYGQFQGVRNYLILAGPKAPDLEERIGWYGERMALKAAGLGLDSCWVAMTFRKGAVKKETQGRLVCVLALGYGESHGVPHKSKSMEELCRAEGELPPWFRRGMEGAMLAPTAMNQQKFRFRLLPEDRVRGENLGGPYSKTDLGIVKYHFQEAAGRENFRWAEE